MLANSHPMAPPPMTATRAGSVSSMSTSSLVITGPDGLEAGDGARHGAGGEDDVGAVSVLSAAVGVLHRDGAVGAERAGAVEDGDLLRLHEAAEALHDAVDDLLLAGLGSGEVDDGCAADSMPNSAACARAVARPPISRNALAGMQPRFRQVPPERALLDQGHLQAGRRGVQRCAVAAGAATDHHEVELLCPSNACSTSVGRWD